MRKHRIAVIVLLLTMAIITPIAFASGGLSGTYSTKITKPMMIRGTWKIKFAAGVDTVDLNGTHSGSLARRCSSTGSRTPAQTGPRYSRTGSPRTEHGL